MILFMILAFIIGYVCIAMESPLKVNKAASALILSTVLWVSYIVYAQGYLPNMEDFKVWAAGITDGDQFTKVVKYVTEKQIVEHLGDVAQTLFFLMGAMTIVQVIDEHGGFSIITNHINTDSKKKLLWIIAIITFCLSAILDNLTTAIVMIMLLRKLVKEREDRWIFGSIIIIAANCGGAFSPIGDVTTIMLWVKGNVTTGGLIPNLIIPALLALFIPVIIAQFMLKGDKLDSMEVEEGSENVVLTPDKIISDKERRNIFFLGIGALIFTPIFKSITSLPPFIGIMFGLSILWIYTEYMYSKKKGVPEETKGHFTKVLGHIDFSTILFFLGILMSVAALQCAGILGDFANVMDQKVGNPYVIDIIIGFLSSIVDNVPLVAGTIGMYDIASTGPYMQDGIFWMFLAFCAGVGGSILIIGSAAGVVVMGLEKINFIWYLKKITILALAGYLAGCGWYVLQESVLRPMIFG